MTTPFQSQALSACAATSAISRVAIIGIASPLSTKGIGELGATGVAAAVANAVFHATGNASASYRSYRTRW